MYDLGGGTFDVSIIEIGDNLIQVLATSGDNHLGGDDFDQRIVHYLVEQFKQSEGINIEKDIVALQRVREESRKAKERTFFSTKCQYQPSILAISKGEPHHMDINITRSAI